MTIPPHQIEERLSHPTVRMRGTMAKRPDYHCSVCGRRTVQGDTDRMCLRCMNELLVANGKRPAPPKAGMYAARCSGHGITEADYLRMFTEQDGRCAICRQHARELLIDHNHTTNEVRGLLCQQCNVGLGHLKDSPAVLRAALEYLEERGCYGAVDGAKSA